MGDVDEGKSTFEKYLAPNYPYHSGIVTPEHLGMEPKGTMEHLGKNARGLVDYGRILVTGVGKANKNENTKFGKGKRRPLGDRIFIASPGQCTPVKHGYLTEEQLEQGMKYKPINPKDYKELSKDSEPVTVPRHVYVDHIPTGEVPGVGNLKEFRGLIPGLIGNVLEMNPAKMIGAFTQSPNPPCVHLDTQTITFNRNDDESTYWNKGEKGKHTIKNQKAWVAIDDLATVNPCSLKKTKINGQRVGTNRNPYNPNYPANCGDEGFENLFKEANLEKIKLPMINFKNKPIAKIFNTGFGLLLAYLLYNILKKEIKL
tara:strand:- start:4263 stop:5207 length:945 start_codon:yes stop_codon:yes gene_type:complete